MRREKHGRQGTKTPYATAMAMACCGKASSSFNRQTACHHRLRRACSAAEVQRARSGRRPTCQGFFLGPGESGLLSAPKKKCASARLMGEQPTNP